MNQFIVINNARRAQRGRESKIVRWRQKLVTDLFAHNQWRTSMLSPHVNCIRNAISRQPHADDSFEWPNEKRKNRFGAKNFQNFQRGRKRRWRLSLMTGASFTTKSCTTNARNEATERGIALIYNCIQCVRKVGRAGGERHHIVANLGANAVRSA